MTSEEVTTGGVLGPGCETEDNPTVTFVSYFTFKG